MRPLLYADSYPAGPEHCKRGDLGLGQPGRNCAHLANGPQSETHALPKRAAGSAGGFVLLPRARAHCRKCHGQLRALRAQGLLFIICDRCDVATLAPQAYRALIEDLLCPC